MEPFQLSLNQVNFEEQELTGDTLHAFSNIVCYDSDFQDPDSQGIPVLSKKYNPQNFTSEPLDLSGNEMIRQHYVQEQSYQDFYQSSSTSSLETSLDTSRTSRTKLQSPPQPKSLPPTQEPPRQPTPPNHQSSKASTPRSQGSAAEPASPSFKAFTETVEALALQKSVIGSSDVTPASSEEIARAIEEAQQRIKNSYLTDSETSGQSDFFNRSPVTTPQEESIEITMTTHGDIDIVLRDQEGNSISSPSLNGNITITPPDKKAKHTPPSNKVTPPIYQGTPPSEIVTPPLDNVAPPSDTLNSEWQDNYCANHNGSVVNGVSNENNNTDSSSPQTSSESHNGHPINQITSEDLGMDLSGKHLVKSHGPKDPDYVNVKYVRTDGDQILDPDYVNVRYVRKNGDDVLQFDDQQDTDKQLIRIQSHEMTIEKSPAERKSWFGERVPRASHNNVPETMNRPAPIAAMAEFDLGEGNQLYFDPNNPEQSAKDAQPKPKYACSPQHKVQQIPQGPRINVVLPEKKKPDLSTEQIAQELERVMREKAKLEGQLEVLDEESRAAIRDRAELHSQVAALQQQLKSTHSSTQGLLADRNAMAADLDTLRTNRARLEQVIVDAQKLLEDKDSDLHTLREDINLSKRAQEQLQATITDLKRDVQSKETTTQDLKGKIAELYVQFQTCNQSRILLENEVKSLNSEITSLTTAKEWYQQQLQNSQQAKQQLQKDLTAVRSENIAQGTLVERLKADGTRAKQQLTATQQRMLREKELLARHLEAIEADMLEREAAFVNIQKQSEQNQDNKTLSEEATADLAADLKKAQNELRRKNAALAMTEHEKSELVKRLTLVQESLLERDRSLESLEHKYVDVEVQLNQMKQEIGTKDEEVNKITQEKSILEVELGSLREEKKIFDNTLQSLKQDMSKVERSFRHMKTELTEKTQEVNRLRGGELRQTNSQTDDSKLLEEDYAKLKKQFQTYREKALHEIADLKAKNQGLNLEISKLKSSIVLSESQLSTPEREISEESANEQTVNNEQIKEIEKKLGELEQAKQSVNAELAGEKAVTARQDSQINEMKKINEDLRLQIAELQRETHKEIAKQKAKALKLGKDLEQTLRDKRIVQQSLHNLQDEHQARIDLMEKQKQQMAEELQKTHDCLALDLDHKTKAMQQQLEAVTTTLTLTQEEKVTLETSLREREVELSAHRLDTEAYQVKIKNLEDQVTSLRAATDKQKEREYEEKIRLVQLELEKEKGRLAGLNQSYEQLKQHTSSLEAALAQREGSVVELSSHSQEELASKDKELTDMRETMKHLREDIEREKMCLKEGKKQLMTEKGNHVKTRRKLETLWVEHDQLKVDLRQKLQELEQNMAQLQKSRENELKHKMDRESAETEVKGLRMELERLRREALDRQAKDPVLYEQIKSLEWQLSEKNSEVTALRGQVQLAEDRQQMEVSNLQMMIQSSQGELSRLREELSSNRRDKASLVARQAEIKAVLQANLQQIKNVQSSGEPGLSAIDVSSLEKLLTDDNPTATKSKPLSFLQSTLSDLRGEITSLQDQMQEHASAVQNSSQAWRELEQQVEDLREVCKSSAATRTYDSDTSFVPPLPAAAAAIVKGDSPPVKFIQTSAMTPNSVYSPKKQANQ